jgi:hypothetical protein
MSHAGLMSSRTPRRHHATPPRPPPPELGSCRQSGFAHFLGFLLGGAFTTGQAAQPLPPPKKTRTRRPSRAPCVDGVHTPTAGATATPQRPSRRHAGRRDPRRRRARHPSCLRRAGRPRASDPLAHDPQLASAAVSGARLDSVSSHPGRAYFRFVSRTRRTRRPQLVQPTAVQPTAGAITTPQRSSRRYADRRARPTSHVADVPYGTPARCLRWALEHRTHWRATCSWPALSLCPLSEWGAGGQFS